MDTENTHRRGDRLELASRAVLGLALLTGVAWALIEGGVNFGF